MEDNIHVKLSYSQINNFHTCPRKWKFQYIDEIPLSINTIHLKYGSAVHYVLENLLYLEMNQKESLELGETKEEIIKNGLKYIQEEIKEFTEEDLETLLLFAEEDLERFENKKGFYERLNDSEIIGVEKDFDLIVPGKYKGEKIDIHVRGFIDLIYKDKDGNIIVVDHKTSKKTFNKSKRRSDLQLPIYFMAIKQDLGEYPKSGVYNFTKLNKEQESLFSEKITKPMEEAMNKRNPKEIYACTPLKAKKEIQEVFRKMNNEKERNKAKPSPLCYWCNYKTICRDASNWKPKEK